MEKTLATNSFEVFRKVPDVPPEELPRIVDHYLIEKDLAARLRHSTRRERTVLYSTVYNELFRRVPDHPQLTLKEDPTQRQATVGRQLKFLSRFLKKQSVYLEIGPGDCALAARVALRVDKAYGYDVTDELTQDLDRPDNLEVIVGDGVNIGLDPDSVDVAFSNQLMEHLHPEDALDQVRSIFRALKTGGVYVCLTPNRLTGPHDVSYYFDVEATGFHLREYTHAELKALFLGAGFRRVSSYVEGKGYYFRCPLGVKLLTEHLAWKMGPKLREALVNRRPLRSLLNMVILVARK
ncbi:MAG: class I SAM-dependent methyltransferase [Proteobacteria bacterium]|nr:class I SAM-dependent methyltransferase [Pseudomonadota bacterium]